MRKLALLALVAVAAAEPERDLARAQAHLTRGRERLTKARAAQGNAQRLQMLERAEFFLGRADRIAAKIPDAALRDEIRSTLVDATVRTGAVYYERRSLPRARRTVERALGLDPQDAKAKALLAAIRKAEDTDVFESVDGVVAIDRLQGRRLEAGVPLRDRGVARRR